MAEPTAPATKPSQTYPGGCRKPPSKPRETAPPPLTARTDCGYIRFDVTLSPPLAETKVLNCSCSMCRRGGYLLVCTLCAVSPLSPPCSRD